MHGQRHDPLVDRGSSTPSRSARQWFAVLPQPFKTLWVVAAVVMLVGVVGFTLTGVAALVAPALVVIALAGAVLALDVRRNATQLTELLRSGRWLGQDLSGSLLARPWYPRLVGAGVVVVAVVLGAALVLDPTTPQG